MKRFVGVLTVVGLLVQGVAVSQGAEVSAEYRERASHQLDAALGLMGTVTYETSQMTYLRAGEVVEDLGGGKKKMKVDTVPGAPVEVWQEGPQTSAVVGMSGKGELTLKSGEVTMTADYGKGRELNYRFEMPKVSADKFGTGTFSMQELERAMVDPIVKGAPLPIIPVALAAMHLEAADVKESGGKLTLTDIYKGKPVRERIVDASTGQLLSDRIISEGGGTYDERVFTGTTMVKGLPMPTAIRFVRFTPTGELLRMVDVTDIKYDLK